MADDAARDGEPQTRSALPARCGFLFEFLEDAIQPVGRDTGPGILDREYELAGRGVLVDRHTNPARFREFDGVPGKVDEHLPQPIAVAQDDRGHRAADEAG